MLAAVKRRRARLRDVAGKLEARGIVGTIAALAAGTLHAGSIGVLLLACTTGVLLLACASSRPEPKPPPAWDEARRDAAAALEAVLAAQAPPPPGEVVVRLAFAAGADLDLYVTDPLSETVYYANTPVRSGGALDADRRCEDAAPRVETVRFAKPLAGRYRVGVDFQQRCPGGEDVAPWSISIEAGGARRLLTGLATWNVFASRVDEFVSD
jgi:hypothetical protein